MTAAGMLTAVRSLGLRIAVESGDVCIDGDVSRIPPDLMASMRSGKAQLLAAIDAETTPDQGRNPPSDPRQARHQHAKDVFGALFARLSEVCPPIPGPLMDVIGRTWPNVARDIIDRERAANAAALAYVEGGPVADFRDAIDQLHDAWDVGLLSLREHFGDSGQLGREPDPNLSLFASAVAR